MRNRVLPAVVRLLAFVAPLFLLHLYSRSAFEHASTRPHHGDTGLGIAVLLGFLTLLMLGAFLIDVIIQIRKRRTLNYLADACILLMLLTPFGWFACNWFGFHDSSVCRLPIMFFNHALSWLHL